MKKQLLALAVAGAIAAPAMAQNVSISGTFDFGIGNKETSGANVTNSKNDDNLSSSVLSIKVSEDLGQGMKAGVELTTALTTGDGGTDELATSVLFDEASYVFVSSGSNRVSFGRIGTAYDDHKSYANMGANLFTDTDSLVNKMAVPAAGTSRFDTKVGGVGLTVSYSDGSDAIEQTTNSIASVAATYSINGFDLAYAQGSNNDGDKEQLVNVGTKIGPVGVRGQFMIHKDSSASSDAKVSKLGFTYSTGPWTFLAVTQKLEADAANTDETANGAMAIYNLSKRTSAYVGYNKRGGEVDISESTIGLQHKF
jgi:predicted porin